MKKVFFSPTALSVIPVDEVGNYRLVGYAGKKTKIKGVLTLNVTKTIGVTLVNGPADEDEDMPATHPAMECTAREMSEMMKQNQDEFDFYVFENMADLLMWLLPE